MYLYAEHYAGKGPNEVISRLDHYLSTLPATTKRPYKCIVAYLQCLVHQKLEKIQFFYPLQGHSRLPCDCDFTLIEKQRSRKDRVIKPSEWVNEIKNTDISNPFQIAYVARASTHRRLSNDGASVIKVMDYKKRFCFYILLKSLATTKGLLFRRGQQLMCRFSMTGDCLTKMCLLKRGKNLKNFCAHLKTCFLRIRIFLKSKRPSLMSSKLCWAMSKFLTTSLF